MDGHCKEKSGLACCFCESDTGVDGINPCDVDILTNCDKEKEKQHNQTFWCHIECFRKSLHGNIRHYLILDLLPNKVRCTFFNGIVLTIIKLKTYIKYFFKPFDKKIINGNKTCPIFLCCFCDQYIESTNVNPCDINVLTNWNKTKNKQDNQTFYCHVHCFEEKLHDSVRGYLIVQVIEDE